MSENKRYSETLKHFRNHFHLTQENVEYLAKLNKNKYSRIESGGQEANLDDVKSIAHVYGLSSAEMLVDHPKLPTLKKLPLETRKLVLENRKAGKKASTYKTLGLTKQIKSILSNYTVKDTFIPSEIFAKLPPEIKELAKTPSRVTDRFIEELAEYVRKTGKRHKVAGKKGRQEEYYELIKEVEWEE